MFLRNCHLSSPNILASDQLQLDVEKWNWPGGWAAAAEAWPNVKDAVWEFNSKLANQSLSSSHAACISGQAEDDAFLASRSCLEQAFKDIFTGFTPLKATTVKDMSWLSVEAVQHVGQRIQRVHFSTCQQHSNTDVSSSNQVTDDDCEAVKDWLQRRLPWAGVVIERAPTSALL